MYSYGMATINPYINFNGNAEEAFIFYKSVFGGEFTELKRFKTWRCPVTMSQNMMRIK